MLGSIRHLWSSVLVALIAAVTTFFLWKQVEQTFQRDLHDSVVDYLKETSSLIEQRVASYEQVLRGAQALMSDHTSVRQDILDRYVDIVTSGESASGVDHIEFLASVPPPLDGPTYERLMNDLALGSVASPESQALADTTISTALGMDAPIPKNISTSLAEALQRATNTGFATISAPQLIEDRASREKVLGFVYIVPVYRSTHACDNAHQRRIALRGWLIMPLTMRAVMGSLYGKRPDALAISLFDGIDTNNDTKLYATASWTKRQSGFEEYEYIVMGGRTWTLAVAPLPGFEANVGSNPGPRVLIIGGLLGTLMTLLTWQLATSRERAQRIALRMTNELRQIASTDYLTGAPNRRHFMTAIESEFTHLRQSDNRPACFLAIDIDHFKDINDRHGHAAGDRVLQTVSHTISKLLRTNDLFGRVGGEEFSLFLRNTRLDDAQKLAERLRASIEQAVVEHEEKRLHVTISIGIANILPGDPDYAATMRRADHALYTAKTNGRNRVETAEQ